MKYILLILIFLTCKGIAKYDQFEFIQLDDNLEKAIFFWESNNEIERKFIVKDYKTGNILESFSEKNLHTTQTCFSSNGDLLAIGGFSGLVKIYSFKDKKFIDSFTILQDARKPTYVSKIEFSDDDRFLFIYISMRLHMTGEKIEGLGLSIYDRKLKKRVRYFKDDGFMPSFSLNKNKNYFVREEFF
jgi:hypothetical protein